MDDVVESQIGYYRARAEEYDEWWFRTNRYDQGAEKNAVWFGEVAEVEAALAAAKPRGNTLEIACGTGLWTRNLAPKVDRLLALDAADEPMAIARGRVNAARVTYLKADIFSWAPTEKYDFIFFGFWISHIPSAQWPGFWRMVAAALAPGGSIFFLDNRRYAFRDAFPTQTGSAGADELETRTLNDGRTYTIVKNFFAPGPLERELATFGLRAEVRETDRFFIYGQAHGV